jgi:hypothetical protein
MHRYHLILADGSQRDIPGDEVTVIEGSLVVRNTQGAPVVVYAPGTWQLCELERLDDKG